MKDWRIVMQKQSCELDAMLEYLLGERLQGGEHVDLDSYQDYFAKKSFGSLFSYGSMANRNKELGTRNHLCLRAERAASMLRLEKDARCGL